MPTSGCVSQRTRLRAKPASTRDTKAKISEAKTYLRPHWYILQYMGNEEIKMYLSSATFLQSLTGCLYCTILCYCAIYRIRLCNVSSFLYIMARCVIINARVSLARLLYCVECPQYRIRLEALCYLCTSYLLPAFDDT